ncbi:MAG: ribosome assembly cofactor RimP [Bacteroidales bacterium]|nr:ribosome assembly cofactor RimP [Bacteroidales bacterium]
MKASEITEKITPAVESCGAFLVDVTVSPDNDIEIVIESKDDIVRMEDCVAIDKAFHEIWNQDEEDYALTVSSAGLDRPFKVLEQYRKAIGSKVVAKVKGGRKFIAELTAADAESVTLRYTAKVAIEGKKKKEEKEITETIPMLEVNSITYYISLD